MISVFQNSENSGYEYQVAPDMAMTVRMIMILEDIVFNYRAYGLPCFETIRRARQRVQSLFPEYSRNPQKEEQSGSISIVINIS